MRRPMSSGTRRNLRQPLRGSRLRACLATMARLPLGQLLRAACLWACLAALALAQPALAQEEEPTSAPPAMVTPDYDYWIDGNPQDAQGAREGGLILVGGGGYVDPAFRWMIERSGGGDFLVLRAAGDAEMHPHVMGLGPDSVETLLLKDREASYSPFVLDRLHRADAIFLAGGDQSRYVNRWKDTPVEDALNEAAARGVPIGGTSAGLAIMGEYCFTALHDTITSDEAMRDPADPRITLARDFLELPHMAGVLTDTHFGARERMGRLVTFLARVVQEGWSPRPRAVGVDELTAVLVAPDGQARVVGLGSAFFVRPPGPPERCAAGQPVTYRDVEVLEVPTGSLFDFVTWTGFGPRFRVTVQDGALTRDSTGP